MTRRIYTTHVTVNRDVLFTRVRLDEHESRISSTSDVLRFTSVKVVEVPIDCGAIFPCTCLNSLDWGDQVCKTCRSRTPPHGQDTVRPTTASVAVGATDGRGSIRTDDRDIPGFVERKGVFGVLQEGDAGSGDVVNNSPVITSDVNTLVLGVIQWVPSIEVRLRVPGVLANEVPSGENSARAYVSSEEDNPCTRYVPHNHIINSGLRDGTVVYISSQVPSEIRIVGVEEDITRHGHVETGNGRDGTHGCLPVGHDFYKRTRVKLHGSIMSRGHSRPWYPYSRFNKSFMSLLFSHVYVLLIKS